MGRVHNQTVNEGRGCQEFYNWSLSEEKVISKLIKHRAEIDEMFELKLYYDPNPHVSNDVRTFKEPIEVIYIDLDLLIEKTKLSEKQRFIIDLLMKGYNFKDISDLHNLSLDTISNSFDIACKRLKEQNDYDWLQFIETSGNYKISDDVRYKQCNKCGDFKRLDNTNFSPKSDSKDGFWHKCKKCR